MSDLSVFLHQAGAAIAADVASLKAKLASEIPELSAEAQAVISSLEGGAAGLISQGTAALQTEVNGIPVIGPSLSAAVAAAGPTLLTDLQTAATKLNALVAELAAQAQAVA